MHTMANWLVLITPGSLISLHINCALESSFDQDHGSCNRCVQVWSERQKAIIGLVSIHHFLAAIRRTMKNLINKEWTILVSILALLFKCKAISVYWKWSLWIECYKGRIHILVNIKPTGTQNVPILQLYVLTHSEDSCHEVLEMAWSIRNYILLKAASKHCSQWEHNTH